MKLEHNGFYRDEFLKLGIAALEWQVLFPCEYFPAVF